MKNQSGKVVWGVGEDKIWTVKQRILSGRTL